MSKTVFRAWSPDQCEFFPPAFRDLVPSGHLVHFVRKVATEDLNLSTIYARYDNAKGQPPYDPRLMVALLLYACCRGIVSSRKIEIACEERLDFRALVGSERPDHDTICAFRTKHWDVISELFVQVLQLCRDAGMAKLGHVSLDGTKVAANASKHAAMSYKRMKEAEPELAKKVEAWKAQADQADAEEDQKHGKDKRGDEVPEYVTNAVRKLAKVRAAKDRLEGEAKEKAEQIAAERAAKEAETGEKPRGRVPKALDGLPDDKAQSNFTDPESHIMKTKDGYTQAYNAQGAVDADDQVIVAAGLCAEQNDAAQLAPMLDQIEANTGSKPVQVSADAGYCSEENLAALDARKIDGYVATGRQKHGDASATGGEEKKKGPLATAMREKLRAGGWDSPYRLRKQTVEPVFGQIKEARGFRRFLHRGLTKARAEWRLHCTAHNLLKLFARVAAATPRAAQAAVG
ncbi:MAG: IS1182 family transposase [Planctomycetes bacterium]|nr:IS1182 family transposase [Planctomycetota bacterium]